MKRSVILSSACILAMTSLAFSGCIVANNGGGKLTDDERAEIEEAVNEAEKAINEAGSEMSGVLDKVQMELDEEMDDVDWAKEFFDDFDDSDKDIKFIKASTEDGSELSEVEDEKKFIKNLAVDSWDKTSSLPEDAQKEAEYIIKQQGTETLMGDNENKYYEIARLEIYETKDGSYGVFEMLSDETLRKFTDIVSEDWLTSVYKIPEETAAYLK